MDKDISLPLVSVIMPVYNSAPYLGQAIESILNQTYTNFEFLIYNDGSTDESAEIISSYNDERIIFFNSEINRGNVHWVNEALSIAKGDFIARMDSDDIAVNTRFSKQVGILVKNQKIGVCGSWIQPFKGRKKLKSWRYSEKDHYIKVDFLFGNPIANPTAMIRKSLFDEHSLKYSPEYFPAEDYLLWYELSRLTEFYNEPEVLLFYRIHDKQSSTLLGKEMYSSNKVLKLFLLQSGLISKDELKIYEDLIIKEWQQTETFLFASGTYLNELVFKNNASGPFDKVYFRKKIQVLFWRQCYFASKKNINGLKLYKNLMPDKYYSVPFLHIIIVYLKYKFGYTNKQKSNRL